jgi:hypothetical protein
MPRGTTASTREVNFFVTTWAVASNIRQVRQTLERAPAEDWNRSTTNGSIRQFESLLRSHGVQLPKRPNTLPIEAATLNQIIAKLSNSR